MLKLSNNSPRAPVRVVLLHQALLASSFLRLHKVYPFHCDYVGDPAKGVIGTGEESTKFKKFILVDHLDSTMGEFPTISAQRLVFLRLIYLSLFQFSTHIQISSPS